MKKRKIQIDTRGTFEVYGDKPWMLCPHLENEGQWFVTNETHFSMNDPLNCLIKITNTGARIPVVFTGNGIAVGEEIVEILNSKL